MPNSAGIKRNLTCGLCSKRNYHDYEENNFEPLPCAGDTKFQLGSVVNARPFSCSLYTFLTDSAARIQGQAEWSCQTLLLKGLLPRKQDCLSNQDLTSFGFLNCLIMSNSSNKMGENRLASRRKQGYTQKKAESVEDVLRNPTILPLGLISEAMDLTVTRHHLAWGMVLCSSQYASGVIITSHMLKLLCPAPRGLARVRWGWNPAKLCMPSPGPWNVDLQGVTSSNSLARGGTSFNSSAQRGSFSKLYKGASWSPRHYM